MDFAKAIDENRTALNGIVASLFALLGLVDASGRQMVPRQLHTAVLRMLRPAESAVRRLIFAVSLRLALRPAEPRPMPTGNIIRRSISKTKSTRFRLEDRRAPIVPPASDPVSRRRQAILTMNSATPVLARAQEIDGSVLLRRLQAVAQALDDLPRQAIRMARWTARRARLAARRLVYTSPLRAGRPPGQRKVPILHVEHVLARCQWLAYTVRRDTS
jgi:hypothetical protein